MQWRDRAKKPEESEIPLSPEQIEALTDRCLGLLRFQDPKYLEKNFYEETKTHIRTTLLKKLHESNPWYTDEHISKETIHFILRASARSVVQHNREHVQKWYSEEACFAVKSNVLLITDSAAKAMLAHYQEHPKAPFNPELWYDHVVRDMDSTPALPGH